jgi:hypothetical protein
MFIIILGMILLNGKRLWERDGATLAAVLGLRLSKLIIEMLHGLFPLADANVACAIVSSPR